MAFQIVFNTGNTGNIFLQLVAQQGRWKLRLFVACITSNFHVAKSRNQHENLLRAKVVIRPTKIRNLRRSICCATSSRKMLSVLLGLYVWTQKRVKTGGRKICVFYIFVFGY